MASLSTCHLGLWLGWQILLNLVKYLKSILRKKSGLCIYDECRKLHFASENIVINFAKNGVIQVKTSMCNKVKQSIYLFLHHYT